MTPRRSISNYISILVFSILMLFAWQAQAQGQTQGKAQNQAQEEADNNAAVVEPTDSVAFFNGFAVSADLVGPLQLFVGDYGQYEAALRINLKDRWFPIFELGYGKGEHNDEVTLISTKTNAPYGRVGIDFNLMKNKHDKYRIYVGVRYAYTNFKTTYSHPDIEDPYWGGKTPWGAEDVSGKYHWAEAVFSVDASIWGPIHLGWSARYKKRLSYSKGDIGNAWYVPGFGKNGSTRLGGTFNVIIDI